MTVEIPVRPDEFLLDLLEDDHMVPCNVTDSCSNGAAWAARCGGCGHDHQACQFHHDRIDAYVASMSVGPMCLICNAARMPKPLPWRPL